MSSRVPNVVDTGFGSRQTKITGTKLVMEYDRKVNRYSVLEILVVLVGLE